MAVDVCWTKRRSFTSIPALPTVWLAVRLGGARDDRGGVHEGPAGDSVVLLAWTG